MTNDPFAVLNWGFVWDVVKVVYVFGVIIYLVFSVLVIKQVRQMTAAVTGSLTIPLKMVSYAHSLAALLLLLVAITVL